MSESERDELSTLTLEMIRAGVRVFDIHLSDRFGANGYPFVESFISDVYVAIRGAARPSERLMRSVYWEAESDRRAWPDQRTMSADWPPLALPKPEGGE